MKKFVLVSLVMLATVCFACQSYGQGSLAPLYLFTNGSGSIAPLQNGQLLEVGQSYDMTAIPDSGFVFSSWQPVNVFVSTQISSDPSGGFVTNTSLVSLPVGEYLAPVPLIFIMQPPQVLFSNPGVQTVIENSGWQANFEPVPEPSDTMLIAYGFTAVAWFRRKRLCHQTLWTSRTGQAGES